ncbi:hypothetical protein N8768_05075 [Flavobacteriaceae bacterium]|jgi:hypothetical protein|nr:hypothetical protein [Flavobacteriaceae bacterium]
MKKIIFMFGILTIFSCKQRKEQIILEDISVAQKIANAHGFKNWDKVTSISFTFGGQIEDTSSGRSWTWNPKTKDIRLKRGSKIIAYNQKQLDSSNLKIDKAFINDKFWAFIPFQLVWDTGISISEPIKTMAPVTNIELNKLTLLYSNQGGYTPGDAYDIYFNNDYIIMEWTFRKNNSTEATLTNTFENYVDIKGIKVAQEHRKADGKWNLLIRDLKIQFEE